MANHFRFLLCVSFFILHHLCWAQEKEVFKIYNDKGKVVSYDKVLKELADADVILFGELHNNALIHWLQLEMTQDLFKKRGSALVLGAEMFEKDDQLILDEYLNGIISTKNFEDEAKLWNNYKTDYKPLVEFARQNKLGFFASNVPRRYASMVARKGLDTLQHLSSGAKNYLPKLPMQFSDSIPGYQIFAEMQGHTHGMPFMAQAQALKDATMAESIIEHVQKSKIILHFHGAFHAANKGGIYWYLKNYNPNLNVKVIHAVESPDLNLPEEEKNSAEFILVVPENFTKTY